MHDARAGAGQLHMGRGEAETAGIFAQIGQEPGLLTFELEAQTHDGVHVAHGLFAVGINGDGPRVHAGGQERARGAEADVYPELGEQVDVGAAVGAVTQNEQVLSLEGVRAASPDLTQGKGVEQRLRGVGVPAVPGVDHAAVQAVGQKTRCAAARMADDDDVRVHGLKGQRRILQAFALLKA